MLDTGCSNEQTSTVAANAASSPFSHFSPFLTISLCRAGQYLSHPVFSVLCHVFSQSVFLHVSLYVSFSVGLGSFSERHDSSLSDFAQMWLGSRFRQWPNHFSLLFSRKVSTGFTWASFVMSSFLMWSNLVFPPAHLNILISAEFSLLSSFFFTAQHSEPYVIAGLMIVLKTLSFNSMGIFLSHIAPGYRCRYTQEKEIYSSARTTEASN